MRTAVVFTRRSLATTSSTRSHGAPSTLVTCGAKAGDSATTRRTGPDETTSPSASTTTSSATWATNSTSWVATSTAWPSSARPRRMPGQHVLGGVVEAARGLVEQQHPRPGHQHQRQGEREPLALREVAGVLVAGDAGHQPVEQRRGRRRCRRRRPRTPRRRSRGRAGRRRSAAPARPARADRRGRARRGRCRRRRRGPPYAVRCPGSPRAARTCRSRCAPSGR